MFAAALAGEVKSRHGLPMQGRRTAAAGGIFLFLGLVAGVIVGIARGQLVPWMLYGFGAGVALALMVWLIDRRRG